MARRPRAKTPKAPKVPKASRAAAPTSPPAPPTAPETPVPVPAAVHTVRRRARTPVDVRTEPERALAEVRARGGVLLSEVFAGEESRGMRQAIEERGEWKSPTGLYTMRLATRQIPGTEEREVLHYSAVVRNPGTSQDLINEIDDFSSAATQARSSQIDLYWRIYRTEGILWNAVNKLAAILSGGGRYKVRRAKKGKKQKAREELQLLLDEFQMNVNNSPDDGVVKGARGLKALTQQATRQALVEGDWFGRMVWVEHEVPGLSGRASLPMTIQSISAKFMEPVEELAAQGVEAFYWAPDEQLIRQLEQPKTKEIRQLLKKYVPSDLVSKLKKDKKVFLDSALLVHQKHRGVDTEIFGESMMQPAMFAIAFKRAIESLDLVTIKNLINRLVILKVGNSDKDSPYRDPSNTLVRASKLAAEVEDPGPNMLMVWAGDDLDKLEVSAHDAVLDLNDRHRIADSKIKMATGTPDAILAGTNDGSKSSAFAAMIGAAAQLDELQSGFEGIYTTIGRRIALENGYTDVDVIYEFDNSLMLDRNEERNQNRLDYQQGTMTIRDFVAATNRDPDAVYEQMCVEKGLTPGEATWQEAFMPVQGLPGQGTEGPGGPAKPPGQGPGKPPGQGRKPNDQTGDPTAERPPESNTPEENK